MSSATPVKGTIKRAPARRLRKRPADSRDMDFARDVLKKFRVLFSSIRTHYREVESECGISGSQLWALTEVKREPGISVSELAVCLLVHQSTASNLLDGLEQLALLTKYRTRDDQRIVRLRITAKGRDVLSRAPAPTVGVLLDALQRVRKETLWGLAINMDDLTAVMNRKDQAAEAKPLADL